MSSTVDRIELAELSELVNRSKTYGIPAYNMPVIEEILQVGGHLQATKRRLALCKDRMYVLRDEQGNITRYLDEIINVPKRFYPRLYDSAVGPGETTGSTSSTCGVPLVTIEEVGKALKDNKIVRSGGNNVITVDLLKKRGDTVLENLSVLFSECLKAQKVPVARKNANMILIYKKGDPKDLKNYRPISLV